MKDSFLISVSDITVEYRHGYPSSEDRVRCYDEYEILYVLSGRGKYIVEGREYTIAPGSVFFISPFEYRVCELDCESVYEFYSVRFRAEALSSDAFLLLQKINDNKSSGVTLYTPMHISSSVISLFDRFSYAATLSACEASVYLRSLLCELVVLLSVCDGEIGAHREDSLGAEIMKYLNDYIDRDIPLDKLARRFFISKYHLCRAFKAHSGVSVHSYVRHKRIMYAKQLIESGETAQRASDRVGFGDYSAFYRAYVKIVGRSPSAKGEEADYVLSLS